MHPIFLFLKNLCLAVPGQKYYTYDIVYCLDR